MSVHTTRQKISLYIALTSLLLLFYTVHLNLKTFIKRNTKCNHIDRSNVIFNKNLAYHLSGGNSDGIERLDADGDNADKINQLSDVTKTDYFDCIDFKKLPEMTQSIKENQKGNRGISFISVKIDGLVFPAVYKEANNIYKTFADTYKYHSAKREIEMLSKLDGFPGIPKLFGSCVNGTTVKYIVEKINGNTICNDNGTTLNCSKASFLLQTVQNSTDSPLAALKLAYTTARLFGLLEERHLFFDDISGVNLMFTLQFEVILVDADSLVPYGNTRLLSKLYCNSNYHCSGPVGNLWINHSLNVIIYKGCEELNGICERNRCRGYDTSLHACGMANWYICPLARFFEDQLPSIREEYQAICSCMKQPYPQDRCSFAEATSRLKKLLQLYQDNK